jgi:hypothetical protein
MQFSSCGPVPTIHSLASGSVSRISRKSLTLFNFQSTNADSQLRCDYPVMRARMSVEEKFDESDPSIPSPDVQAWNW